MGYDTTTTLVILAAGRGWLLYWGHTSLTSTRPSPWTEAELGQAGGRGQAALPTGADHDLNTSWSDGGSPECFTEPKPGWVEVNEEVG